MILGFASAGTRLSDLLWDSLMRTLDPGTMGGDTGSFGFLLGMLAVTLVGIFIVSALIGIINTGLEGKLAELRKGRSRVVESRAHRHPRLVAADLHDRLGAGRRQRQPAPQRSIVILADRDKVEMEDEIRARRRRHGPDDASSAGPGSPIDLDDLEIAQPRRPSRAIIVLSPESDDPDADVIKTMLAITNDPRRRPEPYHIVAEIRDRDEPRRRPDGRRRRGRARPRRRPHRADHRPDLPAVRPVDRLHGAARLRGRRDLLRVAPELAGRTFGDALLAFEDSALIGLRPGRRRAAR